MIRKSFWPNLVTSLNLFCGLLAIIYAFEENIGLAGLCIIAAMILDGIDGRLARMLGVTGEFGKELDSLADVITFGAAPALILYNTTFHSWNLWGLVLVGLFPVCGALRLATFNTETHKIPNYFIGIPITAAGSILSLFAMNHTRFPEEVLATLLMVFSYLMVSKWKVPNFKQVKLPRHVFVVAPLMGLVIYGLSSWFPDYFALLLIIPLAAMAAVLIAMKYRRKKRLKGKQEKDDWLD